MEKSVSDQSLYIVSDGEDEDSEVKAIGRIEEDGNYLDFSSSSTENENPHGPGSYTTSWPQSYRYRRSLFVCLCLHLLS